jgi:voltage-gated potassium channel Kch
MKEKYPLLARLRYRFDSTLSRGPIALIGWLGLAAALLIISATLLVLFVHAIPPNEGPGAVFWNILSQALTPNPVDADNPPKYLLVMLVVTLGSLFGVSILIGVLNATIAHRVELLQRGRSRVIERGHVVILGWNEQVFTIISELMTANANRRDACVVVLGEKDKVEMETAIREKVRHLGHTRVVCRSGNPIEHTDLEIANLDTARAILVLSPTDDDPDAGVIKTVLAITNNPRRRREPYHIVAEINDPKNMAVARLVGGAETELVLTGQLIARIIAQTCRQSGLSVVYTELLDFEGDEMYFQEEPGLVGKTFGEALLAYEDSAVLGICPVGGTPQLNPPMDTPIHAGDNIIAISENDTTVCLSGLTELHINAEALRTHQALPHKPERTLILGWNERAPDIMQQLDTYVAPGSMLTVAADRPGLEPGEGWACPALRNQTLECRSADTTDRGAIDGLDVTSFQHVVVLPYSDTLPVQRADARTLITLLHLRDIAHHQERPFAIVSEMLDVRNRELAEVTRADDFIVSDRLVSLMLSQIAENKDLNKVFDELFDPHGSEIFLKRAENYVALGTPINFYTVIEAARRRGETAFGYRRRALADDPAQAHGVVLNPDKSAFITFAEHDRIIVLAEM